MTLRRPPPLDTAMTVVTEDGVTTLADGTGPVADRPGRRPASWTPVDEVAPDVAAEAMLGYPGLGNHPFPTCFACGPDRAEGDGLRIFPGPVGGDRGHVASLWVPHAEHAESGDLRRRRASAAAPARPGRRWTASAAGRRTSRAGPACWAG